MENLGFGVSTSCPIPSPEESKKSAPQREGVAEGQQGRVSPGFCPPGERRQTLASALSPELRELLSHHIVVVNPGSKEPAFNDVANAFSEAFLVLRSNGIVGISDALLNFLAAAYIEDSGVTFSEFDFVRERCIPYAANLGIVTGVILSGKQFIVMDIDDPEFIAPLHKNFPEVGNTIAVSTPSGGAHYYFLVEPGIIVPPQKISYKGKVVGDLKSTNGYVLIPPSVLNIDNPDSARYKVKQYAAVNGPGILVLTKELLKRLPLRTETTKNINISSDQPMFHIGARALRSNFRINQADSGSKWPKELPEGLQAFYMEKAQSIASASASRLGKKNNVSGRNFRRGLPARAADNADKEQEDSDIIIAKESDTDWYRLAQAQVIENSFPHYFDLSESFLSRENRFIQSVVQVELNGAPDISTDELAYITYNKARAKFVDDLVQRGVVRVVDFLSDARMNKDIRRRLSMVHMDRHPSRSEGEFALFVAAIKAGFSERETFYLYFNATSKRTDGLHLMKVQRLELTANRASFKFSIDLKRLHQEYCRIAYKILDKYGLKVFKTVNEIRGLPKRLNVEVEFSDSDAFRRFIIQNYSSMDDNSRKVISATLRTATHQIGLIRKKTSFEPSRVLAGIAVAAIMQRTTRNIYLSGPSLSKKCGSAVQTCINHIKHFLELGLLSHQDNFTYALTPMRELISLPAMSASEVAATIAAICSYASLPGIKSGLTTGSVLAMRHGLRHDSETDSLKRISESTSAAVSTCKTWRNRLLAITSLLGSCSISVVAKSKAVFANIKRRTIRRCQQIYDTLARWQDCRKRNGWSVTSYGAPRHFNAYFDPYGAVFIVAT
ncbi:MAG: hypothetical protein KatS3mg054_0105 [Chloroflexus sp.]|nr:MAG: hypothetical protein KatS3mg054_0105 [Chloroflexus sp.]